MVIAEILGAHRAGVGFSGVNTVGDIERTLLFRRQPDPNLREPQMVVSYCLLGTKPVQLTRLELMREKIFRE